MEQEIFTMDTETPYPVLLIPKTCITLKTSREVTDGMLIYMNIKSTTTDGNEICLYSGLCKIKLIDSYNDNIKQTQFTSPPDTTNIDQIQVVERNNPPYTQSQVWINPAPSSYVYNSYDASESQAKYSAYHQSKTVKQHNTNITQNVYNCSELIHYSLTDKFDHKKFRKIQAGDTNPQNSSGDPNNLFEDDEFEIGVFLSQLFKEHVNKKEANARNEMHYIELQSEIDALKLLSSNIKSISKQLKTILCLGQDSHFGQTIRNFAVNDPSLKWVAGGEEDQKVVVGQDSHFEQTIQKFAVNDPSLNVLPEGKWIRK